MSNAVTVRLQEPVQFGQELVEELVLRPTARAFKDVKIPVPTSEGGSIEIEPFALALVGVRMAGRPTLFADKLSPADMFEVAQVVLGFLMAPQRTGSSESP